ncbi:MAG: phosphate acyltransferase [Candidatus Atribacteria bacterium]|nr:phosphate acyltransferase [Candidatus Atribacteria bacterium]
MKIAVDGWGGDFAPEEIIKGVREAYSPDYTLVVVGPRQELLSLYSQMGMDEERFPIENASQVVGMGESPTEALKKKPDSTIAKGIDLLAQGKIDAFISAGNSGAVMAAAWMKLKRIAQIERPAITALIPNPNSVPFFWM